MPAPDAQPHTIRPPRRMRALFGLLGLAFALVLVYSELFHVLMAREGQHFSWFTGVYWTLETMTTLGFGDIIFTTDLGRGYSVVVLLTGIVLLFVLLPFTLIQFVYAPWLERRNAARTPRVLSAETSGHVILTAYGPVEAALIQRLDQYAMPYAVIVPDVARALELHDQGVRVMVGRIDDADTFRRAGIERASLVATTLSDTVNANVALTVRDCSETVPIVATAAWEASVDLLKRAGCEDVIQLGELLGRAMARRVAGHGGRTHIIGRLDDLLIAEAAVSGTSLVGQTIRESRLGERLNLNVVGVWNRGEYAPGSADIRLTEQMTLLLAGSQRGLDAYDAQIRTAPRPPATAVVIGGGRVGRATSRNLTLAGIEHRVIEKSSDRTSGSAHYVIGDAMNPTVLEQARLSQASSVVITTHDDDINVYLTLYCRRERPDMLILSRATLQQNVPTLRRAGADFVLSYVPMEANAIFDILRHGNVLSLAEGLEVFTVPVPEALVGKSIAQCNLRQDTGCNVLACKTNGGSATLPDINTPLGAEMALVLIGDRDDERRFFERYR